MLADDGELIYEDEVVHDEVSARRRQRDS
jgi:hypothetical protein